MVYSESGILLQEGHYKDGKEDGVWKFFNEQGRIQYEGPYREGQRVGTWYNYNKKGERKIWKY